MFLTHEGITDVKKLDTMKMHAQDDWYAENVAKKTLTIVTIRMIEWKLWKPACKY